MGEIQREEQGEWPKPTIQIHRFGVIHWWSRSDPSFVSWHVAPMYRQRQVRRLGRDLGVPIWVLREVPALLGTVLVLRLLDAQASPLGREMMEAKPRESRKIMTFQWPFLILNLKSQSASVWFYCGFRPSFALHAIQIPRFCDYLWCKDAWGRWTGHGWSPLSALGRLCGQINITHLFATCQHRKPEHLENQ